VTKSASSSRRFVAWSLRIGALVLVAWAVSGSIRGALVQLSEQEWHVRPAWLCAAGVIYAVGLAPMGWFWQRTLAALGCPTPILPAMFAYFMGHIGKYVPGKAMSVILRVAFIRRWVPSMRVALISTLLETLTMMAVGAFLAAATAALILRLEPLISLAAVAMAIAAGVPTLPPVARRLAALGLKGDTEIATATATSASAGDSPTVNLADRLHAIDYRLLAKGWCAATVCWVLLALSLWATLRAIGVDELDPLADLPRLVACVAFSVVAGFLSLLPAGLGVRDALLMQLLVPFCGEGGALVAAVLVRLVWLVSELLACGILYIAARTIIHPDPPRAA